MTNWTPGLAALAITAATGALAGGIDRTSMSTAILFETGNRLEFGFSNGNPAVSGRYAAGLGGGLTGDMAQSFTALSFGIKGDLNDKLSWAVIVGQPQLANALYTAGPYTGLEAHWRTTEANALLRYKLGGGMSVYGGLRHVTSQAQINIPLALMFASQGVAGSYQASSQTDSKLGYLVGAAYEKPEIALRVALTYSSSTQHSFATTETIAGVTSQTTTDITLPQSVTLDVQTGVAKDTMVFGSIRWAEWSKWQVSPPGYAALGGNDVITGFDNDVFTYTVGVGRKINDSLSLAASFTYEEAKGGTSSRLAPTDGVRALGLAAIYTLGDVKITGGLQYQLLGDAVDGSATRFTDNDALGLGLKIAYSF